MVEPDLPRPCTKGARRISSKEQFNFRRTQGCFRSSAGFGGENLNKKERSPLIGPKSPNTSISQQSQYNLRQETSLNKRKFSKKNVRSPEINDRIRSESSYKKEKESYIMRDKQFSQNLSRGGFDSTEFDMRISKGQHQFPIPKSQSEAVLRFNPSSSKGFILPHVSPDSNNQITNVPLMAGEQIFDRPTSRANQRSIMDGSLKKESIFQNKQRIPISRKDFEQVYQGYKPVLEAHQDYNEEKLNQQEEAYYEEQLQEFEQEKYSSSSSSKKRKFYFQGAKKNQNNFDFKLQNVRPLNIEFQQNDDDDDDYEQIHATANRRKQNRSQKDEFTKHTKKNQRSKVSSNSSSSKNPNRFTGVQSTHYPEHPQVIQETRQSDDSSCFEDQQISGLILLGQQVKLDRSSNQNSHHHHNQQQGRKIQDILIPQEESQFFKSNQFSSRHNSHREEQKIEVHRYNSQEDKQSNLPRREIFQQCKTCPNAEQTQSSMQQQYMAVYQIEDDSDECIDGDTGGSARRKKRVIIPSSSSNNQIQDISTPRYQSHKISTPLQNCNNRIILNSNGKQKRLKLDLRKLNNDNNGSFPTQNLSSKIFVGGQLQQQSSPNTGNVSSRKKKILRNTGENFYSKKSEKILTPKSLPISKNHYVEYISGGGGGGNRRK